MPLCGHNFHRIFIGAILIIHSKTTTIYHKSLKRLLVAISDWFYGKYKKAMDEQTKNL